MTAAQALSFINTYGVACGAISEYTPPPSGGLLNEDGTALLNEDGTPIEDEA